MTPLSDAILLSPITNCDKVACVGLNYSGHCDEQNVPYPKEPLIFSKFSSVIVGPNDNVVIPPITNVSFVRKKDDKSVDFNCSKWIGRLNSL